MKISPRLLAIASMLVYCHVASIQHPLSASTTTPTLFHQQSEANDNHSKWSLSNEIIKFQNKKGVKNTSYSGGPFAGGTGTIEDPFLIETASQLDSVRYFLNHCFKQIADIELGVEPWNIDLGWEPIGTLLYPFTGTYDGNGYFINNLYINRPLLHYAGLFGFLSAAKIRNVLMDKPSVTGRYMVGSIVGKAIRDSEFEYIISTDVDIIVNFQYGGGLMGGIDGSSVRRCSTTGDIVHLSDPNWNYIGGLIGGITSEHSAIGNLIEECYTRVKVNSFTHNTYGGFIGASWYPGKIINCYARGSVIGTNAMAGGFLGQTGANSEELFVSNCYSTGHVTAPGSYVNGFLGYYDSGNFSDNFFDMNTSGHTNMDEGATQKNTSQMKNQSTYTNAGWNFNDIWAIDAQGIINNGYPYFNWQFEPICNSPQNLYSILLPNGLVKVSWLPTLPDCQWEIIWGPRGFDINTEGTFIGNITDPFCYISIPNSGLEYDIYVRKRCSENFTSLWSLTRFQSLQQVFQVSGSVSYCEGEEPPSTNITLSGSSTSCSYQLFRDGNPFSAIIQGTGNEIIWSNMVPGEYTVLEILENQLRWMSGIAIIIEYPLPLTSFKLTYDTICINSEPRALTSGTPAGGIYFGNGITDGIFDPAMAGIGNHVLYYNVTTEFGCSKADSTELIVDECLSIDQTSDDLQIQIFPNPSSDIFQIKFLTQKTFNHEVKIYNSIGSLITTIYFNIGEDQIEIDLSTYQSGVYFVQISGKSETITKAIVHSNQ
ncbi:MAG: T9SS type A sorting domain-containing protein [Bacteroidales bacterium]|nr:T9SS type A sorting domain-containing protein [Bacteroidales bacterium]